MAAIKAGYKSDLSAKFPLRRPISRSCLRFVSFCIFFTFSLSFLFLHIAASSISHFTVFSNFAIFASIFFFLFFYFFFSSSFVALVMFCDFSCVYLLLISLPVLLFYVLGESLFCLPLSLSLVPFMLRFNSTSLSLSLCLLWPGNFIF